MDSIDDKNDSSSKELNFKDRSKFKEKYRIKCHLSAGAHGFILWANDRSSQADQTEFDHPSNVHLHRHYAIKRVFIRNQQIPIKLVREIKTLQFVRGHPNIIDLLDVCPTGSSINLVFPLVPTNLTTLIYSENGLDLVQCCLYFRMLARGLSFLHHNGIIHRDLKPSNLLVDWDGQLKLADFGQARAIDIMFEINGRRSELSNDVCTRWYRSPELLYGATNYGCEVDIWSSGCILAEMHQQWPLFRGETDIEQLSLIVRALGPPSPGEWTNGLPDFNKIRFDSSSSMNENNDVFESSQKPPRWLQQIERKNFDHSSSYLSSKYWKDFLNVLSKLCCYTERWSMNQVLEDAYLKDLDSLPKYDLLLIKPKQIKHFSGPPPQ